MFEARQEYFETESRDIENPQQNEECPICNELFMPDNLQILGQCNHRFCSDCLKYYLSYRIKNQFALIQCPRQGCSETMGTQSKPFLNLPNELQKRYHIIKNNIQNMRHNTQRLCPDCDENLHKGNDSEILFCKKCLKNFCSKCLGKPHPKKYSCEKYMIQFLKKNYEFKRCIKCLFVIQRKEGCSHMTCLCGYEFCYSCGGYWDHGNHICPPARQKIKPLIYRQIKKQIPQRKPLQPNIINITLEPCCKTRKNNQIKRIENLEYYINKKISRVSQKQTNQSNFNDGFLINNRSLVSSRK